MLRLYFLSSIQVILRVPLAKFEICRTFYMVQRSVSNGSFSFQELPDMYLIELKEGGVDEYFLWLSVAQPKYCVIKICLKMKRGCTFQQLLMYAFEVSET
jgi:hypothetical protein